MNTCILSIQRVINGTEKKPGEISQGLEPIVGKGRKDKIRLNKKKLPKRRGKARKARLPVRPKKLKIKEERLRRKGRGRMPYSYSALHSSPCKPFFTKSMGVVGEAVSTYLKGLFGIGGYFLPFIVTVFCVWMIFSEERQGVGLKAGADCCSSCA